jgi:hypothetical protein
VHRSKGKGEGGGPVGAGECQVEEQGGGVRAAGRGGGGHRWGGAQVGEGGGPVEWAATGPLPWAGPKRTVPFCN